jgi:hypothetical protein
MHDAPILDFAQTRLFTGIFSYLRLQNAVDIGVCYVVVGRFRANTVSATSY